VTRYIAALTLETSLRHLQLHTEW